jgi:hypothetical protein
MLFREIIAVYCENHMGYTNTLCGQIPPYQMLLVAPSHVQHVFLQNLLEVIHFERFTHNITTQPVTSDTKWCAPGCYTIMLVNPRVRGSNKHRSSRSLQRVRCPFRPKQHKRRFLFTLSCLLLSFSAAILNLMNTEWDSPTRRTSDQYISHTITLHFQSSDLRG